MVRQLNLSWTWIKNRKWIQYSYETDNKLEIIHRNETELSNDAKHVIDGEQNECVMYMSWFRLQEYQIGLISNK
jgi:hypothetical protein